MYMVYDTYVDRYGCYGREVGWEESKLEGYIRYI